MNPKIEEAFNRVRDAKEAAHYNRADRCFEFTGSQMETLSLAISALYREIRDDRT